MLTGTVAATLIGLLFVSVSINIHAFHRKGPSYLYRFAALTFNCFFYVLLISILFPIPHLSSLELGVPLFLLGGLGLANAVIQQHRIRQSQTNQRQAEIASRFNVHIACLVGLLLSGIGVMFELETRLYGLVLVIVSLLASAAQNAWAILVKTAQLLAFLLRRLMGQEKAENFKS